ncbi:MAG: 5'-nucleotidase C-terminal domain-containing protein [Treponema sp.]|jgi:5'-nucleotidase/UDP-sugar diphosphatase|nr:5'-nucleotidase C-terminal domain-containing protein [Treponema sp.]
MKKRWILFLTAFLFAGVLFAAPIRESSLDSEISGGSGELVLLHTNDHHGAVFPNNEKGGLAEIAAFTRAVKAVNPNVLLVDAGDFNTGSAISNMFDAEPDILAYNIMEYDAVVFGNHEFDGVQEKLNAQIAKASFPFVSSNIKTKDGVFLGGNQYIVKDYGNFTVGIFGITTLRTLTIASPDSSLVFINEIEAAREAVDILRNKENVDIVIGLTHIGDVKETADHITSIELARAVPGIDIIVDGHSHSFMDKPKEAGGAYIISANEWGKYVGYGRLIIQNGKLAGFSWTPIPIGPDPEVTAMLKPYIEKANSTLKEEIGEAAETFVFGNRLTRYQETAIGNLVTDANAWYFRTVSGQDIDFVFHNGGNIRAELPAGQITQERILTILPFENYLFIVSMTGSQIIELFDFVATIPQGNGGFPQFSSDVRYTVDKTSGAGKITELTIGGKPVDPEKTYRFCTNDYILGGGDGYEVMKQAGDHFNTSLLLSYVVTEYIRAQKDPISPVTDGRLKIIGGVTP